jgi:uncharacterized membrane-anchored protein
MGFGNSVPVMLVLMALSAVLYARVTAPRKAGDDTVLVNTAYWMTMMLAGVLGTVGGDLASKRLTDPGAAVVFFSLALMAIVVLGRRGLLLQAAAYWLVVALIRTAGTAGGDSIAHTIGLAPSTVATGVVFLLLVLASSRVPSTAALAAR